MDLPVILIEGEYTKADLDKLKSNKVWRFHDIYKSQLTEQFETLNANLINTDEYEHKLKEYIEEKSIPEFELRGNYVYYPWTGLLLHTIPAPEQNRLRVNRTKNLVLPEEQDILKNFTAGVAGLSFGNGIALSLVYSGASDTIKIADTDIFETTNLNRVRVGLMSVLEQKTIITAQEIYEINPYATVDVFDKGLTDENLNEFVNGSKKLSIIYDVVDDFAMKVKLRLAAKKAKIPVVMLTSLEDSVLVDVERFDLNPEAEIFHGLLGGLPKELLTREMTEQDKARYAMTIVGPESVSYRNLSSLLDVGNKLVSRPHLYGTVSIVCGLASYILKRIALNEDMPSMRKHVKFNEVLGIAPNKDDTLVNREDILSKLMAS